MALSQSQLSEVTKGRAKDVWSDSLNDVFWDVFFVESKFHMMFFFFQLFLDVFKKIIPRSLTILVKK